MKNKGSTWNTWQKAVAIVVLVSPGVLGVGGTVALAAPLAPIAASISTTSQAGAALAPSVSSVATSLASRSFQVQETRGTQSVISIFFAAVKKIPGFWSTLMAGVAKAWTTFVNSVWPKIKAAVGAVSTLISAWEIWSYFH